ncbi:MAG: hypothetical protein ABIA62_07560 [Candidatus Woesearchaeota archaeon]
MFTKTQLRIMQVFVSRITDSFSINKVAEAIGKPYPLVHRSVLDLIKKGFLVRDEHNYVSLNFRKNHQALAYVESMRSNDFLYRPRNSDLLLFVDEVTCNFPEEFFVFLIFGSTVNSKKPNDVDVFVVVDDITKVESTEKFLMNICANYEQKFDIVVVSPESVYEMLAKREKLNVMNEVLNKHLIFHGAETFYRLVDRGRT